MANNHNRIKTGLKVSGALILAGGIALAVTGFVSFFRSISSEEMPTLFWMLFLGIPMIGVGCALLLFGFKKEITRYIKDEAVPVINEAGRELQPAVRSVAQAVSEGINGTANQAACPHCGAQNPVSNKFCKQCGKPLVCVCPVCHAEQPAGQPYCGSCGAKLE